MTTRAVLPLPKRRRALTERGRLVDVTLWPQRLGCGSAGAKESALEDQIRKAGSTELAGATQTWQMATQASTSSRLSNPPGNSLQQTAQRRLTRSDGDWFVGFDTPPDDLMLTATPATFSRTTLENCSCAHIGSFVTTVELFFFDILARHGHCWQMPARRQMLTDFDGLPDVGLVLPLPGHW